MVLSLKVTGRREVERELLKLQRKLGPRAFGAGLYGAGNEIMRDSKRRVPVDLGVLRGSGYVTLPQVQTGAVAVELGYGGPAAAYAVKQHEDTTLNHPEGGSAKFLESAVNFWSGFIPRLVARIGGQALEQGRGAQRTDVPTNPNQGGD